MALYAHLEANLPCPDCGGADALELVWFQWGFCYTYSPPPESRYRIGEAISWWTLEDGTIPGWAYLIDSGTDAEIGANFGDPQLENLVIRDLTQFPPEGGSHRTWRCKHCGHEIHGAALQIESGRIVRAWLLRPGELEVASYHTYEAGRFRPIPELEDPPMKFIRTKATSRPAQS